VYWMVTVTAPLLVIEPLKLPVVFCVVSVLVPVKLPLLATVMELVPVSPLGVADQVPE